MHAYKQVCQALIDAGYRLAWQAGRQDTLHACWTNFCSVYSFHSGDCMWFICCTELTADNLAGTAP